MLGGTDVSRLIDQVWEQLDCRVELPDQWIEFFDKTGPVATRFGCRRRYIRWCLRRKAVLNRGDSQLGIYCKDVSREGLGLVCPVQLFPRERIQVWLPSGSNPELIVTRCIRIAERCYDCGTHFVAASSPIPS